ncbi:MAG: hypothetical protein ACYSUX_07410 [Planctomycetota bacterium]|jgi:hypothetical protein
MTTQTDLNGIERKARRVFQQDGLTILFAGIALAMIAIFFIDIRHGWVFALGIALAISLPELLRRHFVYPRIGYAQFLRQKGITRHILAICLALICLILFYVFGKIARFNWLMPVYLGTVFSVAALIAARRFGLVVYYVLTLVFLLSGLAGLVFTIRDYAAGWVVAFQLWGLAVVMVPVGAFQFTRFLHEYKKPGQEVLDDQTGN